MRKIRYAFIIIVGLFFYTIFVTSSVKYIAISKSSGKKRLGILAPALNWISDIPFNITKVTEFVNPILIPDKSELKDGFTYYDSTNIKSYPNLLLINSNNSKNIIVELWDIRKNKICRKWEPNFGAIPSKVLMHYRFNHPLLLKDSSLVLTGIYDIIMKFDSNGKLLWFNKDYKFHHSIELDAEGNIYCCTNDNKINKYSICPDSINIESGDNCITKLNINTGKVLFHKSIIQLLTENGLEHLIYPGGTIMYNDPIHMNEIRPALYSSKFWQKGDLLISCRNVSLVFLYRPSTNKVIWYKQGICFKQHCVDFYGDNKISIFNNASFDYYINKNSANKSIRFSEKYPNSEIVVYDFETDKSYTPFAKIFKDEKIASPTQGRCTILENGDFFVEETDGGRIIFGDSTKKKIEFIKRFDSKNRTKLFWTRLIFNH